VADGLTELPGPLVVGRQRTQFPDGELLGPFRVLQEHGEQIDAAVVVTPRQVVNGVVSGSR
jgi:hypothetical protein